MRDKIRRITRRLLRRLRPDGDTAEQTVKSGIWMGLMNFLNRGLQLVMVVFLANLLDPKEFGLLGIALLTLSALKKFSNLGLSTALIQDREANVDRYLNTAWVLQFARGVIIAGIIALSAPVVASIFGEPRVVDVIRVIALSPLLLAVRNPAVVYFQKDLDFHKEFLFQTSGSVVRFCVTVGYALVYPNVWALVFGFIMADATRVAVSYLTHPFRPSPDFDRQHAKDLIGYGKWITGSSILVFLITEGDDFVVGTLLGATSLGFYQTAYRLSNAPATEITQVISSVIFPAYSTLQEDLTEVREAYFRTLQMTSFIAFPAALGIAAVAPVFVSTFMGANWMPMVATMQLLTVYGTLRSVGKTTGPVFQALGRPDIGTKLAASRLVLIAIFIIPAVQRFGFLGAAMVVVGVALFPMLLLDIYALGQILDAPYRRFFRDLLYPLVASGAMFVAVVYFRRQALLSGLAEFVFLVVTGLVAYIIAVGVIEIRFEWGIQRNLKLMLSTLSES